MSGNSIDMHGFNPLANSYIQIPSATTNSTANVGSLFLNDMASLTNSFATMMLDNAIQSSVQKQAAKETSAALNNTMKNVVAEYDTKIQTVNRKISEKNDALSSKLKSETLINSNIESLNGQIKKLNEKASNNEAYANCIKLKNELSNIESAETTISTLNTDKYKQLKTNIKDGIKDQKVTAVGYEPYTITASDIDENTTAESLVSKFTLKEGFDKASQEPALLQSINNVLTPMKNQLSANKLQVENTENQVKSACKSAGIEEISDPDTAITKLREAKTKKNDELNKAENKEANQLYTKIEDLSKEIDNEKKELKLRQDLEGEINTLTQEKNRLEQEKASAEALLPDNNKDLTNAKDALGNANNDVNTYEQSSNDAKSARKQQLKGQGKNWIQRVFTGRTDDQKLARQHLKDARNNRNAAQANFDLNSANLTQAQIVWLKQHGYDV